MIILVNTYVSVLRRDLSTEMVLQLECNSTLAVVSVESFTIPIYPVIKHTAKY